MALVFLNRFRKTTETQDWCQQEIADLYRAHNLLGQNGMVFGLDRGLSDEGDPWLIFYDFQSNDAFLHVARIDGRCILACPQLGMKLWGHSIDELLGQFEGEISAMIARRNAPSGNKVVRHPASRAIFAITSAFLFFKISGDNTAEASTGQSEELFDVTQGRKLDGALGRALQQLTRVTEFADTPVVAAAGAAVVLSQFVASMKLNDLQTAETSIRGLAAGEESSLVDGGESDAAFDAIHREAQARAEQNGDHTVDPETELADAEDVAVDAADVDVALAVDAVAPEGLLATFSASDAVAEGGEAAPEFTDEVAQRAPRKKPVEKTDDDATEAVAQAGTTEETEVVEADAVLVTENTATATSAPVETLAPALSSISLVETILSQLDIDYGVLGSAINGTLPQTSSTPVTTVASLEEFGIINDLTPDNSASSAFVTDINISIVDELQTTVGSFEQVSAVDNSSVSDWLSDVFAAFDGFELEMDGGDVLIEQADLTEYRYSDLSIQEMVLSDGSSISVIGASTAFADMGISLTT
ncbi:MAG: hypothetical protein AAFR13_06225 [Pseudomonadota bacterium]